MGHCRWYFDYVFDNVSKQCVVTNLSRSRKIISEASDASIQIVLTLINLITLPMMLLEPMLEKE